MEFRELVYFSTVVEQGSFSHAAALLHITQPTLSISIKNLESNLGMNLINRSTKKLQLTLEGNIFYEETKKMLEQYNLFLDRMETFKDVGSLSLTIGIIPSASSWFLNALYKFKKEYPDVHIKLVDLLNVKDIEKAINSFKVHLCITNQYINNQHIKSVPLYEEELVAVLPNSHPLTKRNVINIDDLEYELMITGVEGLKTREDILHIFHSSNIEPNIKFEVERFELAISLVENNFGITIMPKSYVDSKDTNYKIKAIENENTFGTVYLAYNKSKFILPLAKKFIEMATDDV